jgi:hypothetical protein
VGRGGSREPFEVSGLVQDGREQPAATSAASTTKTNRPLHAVIAVD